LYVQRRVEPKAIVWFQFSEFGLPAKAECSSMANAESVSGGSLETKVAPLKRNVAKWQMLNLCLMAKEPIID
jgi:hypothetical protein